MKLSLTTSKKIWLSVAILLIGYCISMSFGIVLGRKNQLQVQRVANDWFPAANQSQQAASYFNGQIDLYNDALSLQDPEMLALATIEAGKVRESLDKILQSGPFDTLELNTIVILQEELSNFSDTAHTAYEEAIRVLNEVAAGDHDKAFQTRLADVARQSEELHDRLQLEARHFSALLHDELLEVSHDLKREQYLNVTVFLVVTVVALTCIQIILTRSAREILDRDDALEKVMSGEVEFGEAFFQLNSVSANIVEDAEDTAEQSSFSLSLSQKMAGHIVNIDHSVQKLTANIRGMSGKTIWIFERLPDFARSAKGASRAVNSIDRELREIRNLGLVLAELGAQLRGLTDSSDLPHAESVQQSAIRVGEFAEAILKHLSVIHRAIKGSVETASRVEKQSGELDGLVKTMKTALDTQILETHHITLLIDALQQGNNGLDGALTGICERTGNISKKGEVVQNEAQKLLFMVKQLHELVKTAKFKQQILHEHHVSSSKDSDSSPE